MVRLIVLPPLGIVFAIIAIVFDLLMVDGVVKVHSNMAKRVNIIGKRRANLNFDLGEVSI